MKDTPTLRFISLQKGNIFIILYFTEVLDPFNTLCTEPHLFDFPINNDRLLLQVYFKESRRNLGTKLPTFTGDSSFVLFGMPGYVTFVTNLTDV